MSAFDDILAADEALFEDVDGMPGAEEFEYWPKGGDPITVSGVVIRNALELQAKYGIAIRAIVVRVSKSSVSRINSPGDSVKIAFDIGDDAQRHTVKQILTQDAGGFTLLIG